MVNILNFDYLIYKFKKARTGQGIDYNYLSMLSSDSLSYKDQYQKLEKAEETGKLLEKYKNPKIILYKIEHLQKKYSKFDLRTMALLDLL